MYSLLPHLSVLCLSCGNLTCFHINRTRINNLFQLIDKSLGRMGKKSAAEDLHQIRYAATKLLQILSAQGRFLSAQGRCLSAQGRCLSAQGKCLSAQGRCLSAQGRFLSAQGRFDAFCHCSLQLDICV